MAENAQVGIWISWVLQRRWANLIGVAVALGGALAFPRGALRETAIGLGIGLILVSVLVRTVATVRAPRPVPNRSAQKRRHDEG